MNSRRGVTACRSPRHSLALTANAHDAGEVGGDVVEGRVRAEDVRRLLREKPDAKGLMLPGGAGTARAEVGTRAAGE